MLFLERDHCPSVERSSYLTRHKFCFNLYLARLCQKVETSENWMTRPAWVVEVYVYHNTFSSI
jgi:hypothetical protein